MVARTAYIDNLIARPVETLAAEYKAWIDPETPAGRASIIKACLALRNHGGGHLIIGVEQTNAGLRPAAPPHFNPRERFDTDRISQLVNSHSQQLFEVTTHLIPANDTHYPVLEIAAGVRTPAVSRRRIDVPSENGDFKRRLENDVVYVRTIRSGNVVSSAPANEDDWEELMRRCMENREADIGGFLRRNLTPENLATIAAFVGASTWPLALDSGKPISYGLLRAGTESFDATVSERAIPLPPHGAFEVAFRIPDGVSGFSTNRTFLGMLTAHNPGCWGWPLWYNPVALPDEEVRPQVIDGRWQTSLLLLDPTKWTTPSIDFWFASPIGQFFHRRGFWEDQLVPAIPLHLATNPGVVLDVVVQLSFVAEALFVGQSFARAMGHTPEKPKLDFSFRWSGLQGRLLSSNLRPNRLFLEQLRAAAPEVQTGCFLPGDAPMASLHEYVYEATKPLFLRFSGHELDPKWVQEIVDEFLVRRIL